MDYQERLKNLPPEVMTAFSESFIFLISNDKVQHFPARDLTQAYGKGSLLLLIQKKHVLLFCPNIINSMVFENE